MAVYVCHIVIVIIMVSALESQHYSSSALSTGSLVEDEERMRPGMLLAQCFVFLSVLGDCSLGHRTDILTVENICHLSSEEEY